MNLNPGVTVAFVSILDENGETLMTAPMTRPIDIPSSDAIANFQVDIKVNVNLELKGSARR